jgi:hypothetical protein
MGDANVHVKASVLEKRPPAVVERRAPDAPPKSPASLPPGLLGGEREKNKTAAAAAVEGYVPRQNKNRSKTRRRRRSGGPTRDERRRLLVRTEPEAPPSLSRSADASEREPVVSRRALASPLGARALDAHLERNGVGFPDDVKPDAPSEPSDAGPGATFFFDVFAEGLEKGRAGRQHHGHLLRGAVVARVAGGGA